MNIYLGLIIVGSVSVGLSAYLPFQIPNKYAAFVFTVLYTVVSLGTTFFITKRWMEKAYDEKIEGLKHWYENRIMGLKKEYDTTTLEKTIRDGTQTLIKNALDYFKLENIKNEMGESAAIQNLQLDKYGQIIELLADFALILPDIKQSQDIVQEEINHQISIYQIDEKPFAQFMQRIMGKYLVTVNKKIKEKVTQNVLGQMKTCPRCAERVLAKANICKHCKYEFKTAQKSSVQNTLALDRLEKGKVLCRTGEYSEAINLFTSAIEMRPKYAMAYYNRASAYFKTGNTEMGEKDLKDAADLGHKKAQELQRLRHKDIGKIRPPKYRL